MGTQGFVPERAAVLGQCLRPLSTLGPKVCRKADGVVPKLERKGAWAHLSCLSPFAEKRKLHPFLTLAQLA